MATPDFDAIYDALCERLRTKVTALQLVTRRVKHFAQTTTQPSAFVVATGMVPQGSPGMPPVWHLSAMVVIHARTKDSDDSPEAPLLDLIRSVAGALEWQRGEPWEQAGGYATTLGGKVQRAFLDGEIEIDQGAEGGQAVVWIPVTMVVPAS